MFESSQVTQFKSSDDIAIQLDNVSVRYRVPHERYNTLKEHAIRWLERRVQYDDFWALRDVNLCIRSGEVVGIIGRNGAGKSTLLKVVSRVLLPTNGRVRLRGRVAPLLEFGAGFHPELTGRENVFLNGAILGFSRSEMESKFKGIVDFAELWDFIDAPLRTYSSGMVARLGFAIATDVDPDILILDEVLSVGDVAFQQKSAERIQSFRAAGATILMVSHSMDTVEAMCDRGVWLDHGKLMADGNPAAVVQCYRGDDANVESKRLSVTGNLAANQRWGTGRIEIVNVRLFNEKDVEKTIFRTGDPLALQIDYKCHEAVPSPFFGMAIHRQDGIHITGPNSSFAGVIMPTLDGEGTVIYRVPYLPLLEGLYHISVAVVNQDDTEIFDYHDRAYPFRVVNYDGAMRERYGLVTLRGEWEHIAAIRNATRIDVDVPYRN
ncbi:MAG: ABC transporter ATP-binding protein [Chloroflexi bacterium]|nr:ABC transporter ATP-binding protein [Chloroflexota bacterium]